MGVHVASPTAKYYGQRIVLALMVLLTVFCFTQLRGHGEGMAADVNTFPRTIRADIPRTAQLRLSDGQNDSRSPRSITNFQATIVIFTMSRHQSLIRLLDSLKAADYTPPPGKTNDIRLVFRVDQVNKPGLALQEKRDKVLEIARNFQHDAFTGGITVETHEENMGLKKQWMTAFQNPRSDTEVAIFLEDDLSVSPHFFRWTRIQWENHGNNPYLGSVSYQRQTLRATAPFKSTPIENQHRPFLYRLVGTWGLTARADLWLDFTSTYADKDDVGIDGLITTQWWKNPTAQKSMWSQHFIHYLWKKNKYTLFVNLPDKKTLCTNWMEAGEHYGRTGKRDFDPLEGPWDPIVMEAYDADLIRYGFNAKPGNGF
jgi:hypothetical protein